MGKTRSQHYRKKQHTKRRVGRKRHKSHRKHRKRNRHNKRGGSDPPFLQTQTRNQQLTEADAAIVEEAVREADADAEAGKTGDTGQVVKAERVLGLQQSMPLRRVKGKRVTIPRNQTRTNRKNERGQPRILRRKAAAAETRPNAKMVRKPSMMYIEEAGDQVHARERRARLRRQPGGLFRVRAEPAQTTSLSFLPRLPVPDEWNASQGLRERVSDALDKDEPLSDDDWDDIENLDFKQPRLLRELVRLKLENYYSEHPDETKNIPKLLSEYKNYPTVLISMLDSLKRIQTRQRTK